MPLGWNKALAGEEKFGIGSRPCSSRMPVSGSSVPVRLCTQSMSAETSFISLMTHLPFVPTAEKSPGPLSFRGVLPLAGPMAKIDIVRGS